MNYRKCPICGGKIRYSDENEYNSNDELIDVFECENCKTRFESDGNSDILYNYFRKDDLDDSRK